MDVRPAGSAERRDLHLDADRPYRSDRRVTQSEGTNGVLDWSERFEVSIAGVWTGIFTRLEFAYSNDVDGERYSCSKSSGRFSGRLEEYTVHRLLNFRVVILSIECL